MRNPSRHHTLFKLIRLPLSAAILIAAAGAANAAVQITVDKNTQTMEVAVDGQHRWTWPVSTGVPSHETPNGTFRAFRMEADHFSKEWDDAPMPHSIFFTKIGHAIHGTDAARNLGNPASHGCVRLSKDNAARLYELVEQQGVLNTTVTLTGSSQIALARGRQNINVASATPGAMPAQQPLGLNPGGVQQPVDNDPSADPYDYQRQPAPQGYQQNYGAPQGYARPPGFVGRSYQGGYAQRGYVQQPYPQQPYPQQDYAYSQGNGTQGNGGYAQQPIYGGQAYPNYPGYNHGPASGYYYGN
jgi:hypothetical protein